jgi:hypothetical protein
MFSQSFPFLVLLSCALDASRQSESDTDADRETLKTERQTDRQMMDTTGIPFRDEKRQTLYLLMDTGKKRDRKHQNN